MEQGKPAPAHHGGIQPLHRERIQSKTIPRCCGSCAETDLSCCSHEQQESREEPAELEETLGCLDEDARE